MVVFSSIYGGDRSRLGVGLGSDGDGVGSKALNMRSCRWSLEHCFERDTKIHCSIASKAAIVQLEHPRKATGIISLGSMLEYFRH